MFDNISTIFSTPATADEERRKAILTRKLYYWSGIFACVAAPGFMALIIMDNMVNDKENIPGVVGGYCAIWSTLLSIFQIMEHLCTFTQPEKQSKIVRILFMVPLYAMTSWASILWRDAATYFDLVRDAYESYALYNFFTLMLELMGGQDALYRSLMTEEHPLQHHFFPFCYLAPFKFSPRFVRICHRCMFQFMVLKPLTTFVIIILQATNSYGEKLMDLTHGQFYTFMIYNVSISVALTAVVYFYHATAPLLVGQNPLGKFGCIKVVVFLTFWQGVAIDIAHSQGWLPHLEYWTEKEVAVGLQDFAICVEMLFCAFAHKFCFGSQEYVPKIDTLGGPGYGAINNNTQTRLDASEDATLAPRPTTVVTPTMVMFPNSTPWSNLKYVLQHEDMIQDLKDVYYGR
jgi:hypothetical protein